MITTSKVTCMIACDLLILHWQCIRFKLA